MNALPRNWKYLRLEEICSFHRGLTYKKKDEVGFSKNAVLRANNVSLESGALDLTEIRYIDDQIKIPADKKVLKGSLIVCMASGSKKHLGKAALVDEDYGYAFGGFMGLLLPNVIVYPKYLYWITQSKEYSYYIMGLSDGANINNLKFSQLGQYQVPLPPIPEQKRIVAILDEAFAGIATAVANTEKNLANARELFESYLKAAFRRTDDSWFPTSIGAQMTLQRGFDITKKDQRSGNIPVVSSGGIKSYHDTPMVEGPGVVIGRKGSLGTVHYVEGAYWPHDTTLWVKDFKSNNVRLVYYVLRSMDLKRLDSGAANPALNRNVVHPIRITWPVRELQAKLVEALDAIVEECHRLEWIYQRKLVALAELKQSLLQKAFSGELTAGREASEAILKEEQVA